MIHHGCFTRPVCFMRLLTPVINWASIDNCLPYLFQAANTVQVLNALFVSMIDKSCKLFYRTFILFYHFIIHFYHKMDPAGLSQRALPGKAASV